MGAEMVEQDPKSMDDHKGMDDRKSTFAGPLQSVAHTKFAPPLSKMSTNKFVNLPVMGKQNALLTSAIDEIIEASKPNVDPTLMGRCGRRFRDPMIEAEFDKFHLACIIPGAKRMCYIRIAYCIFTQIMDPFRDGQMLCQNFGDFFSVAGAVHAAILLYCLNVHPQRTSEVWDKNMIVHLGLLFASASFTTDRVAVMNALYFDNYTKSEAMEYPMDMFVQAGCYLASSFPADPKFSAQMPMEAMMIVTFSILLSSLTYMGMRRRITSFILVWGLACLAICPVMFGSFEREAVTRRDDVKPTSSHGAAFIALALLTGLGPFMSLNIRFAMEEIRRIEWVKDLAVKWELRWLEEKEKLLTRRAAALDQMLLAYEDPNLDLLEEPEEPVDPEDIKLEEEMEPEDEPAAEEAKDEEKKAEEEPESEEAQPESEEEHEQVEEVEEMEEEEEKENEDGTKKSRFSTHIASIRKTRAAKTFSSAFFRRGQRDDGVYRDPLTGRNEYAPLPKFDNPIYPEDLKFAPNELLVKRMHGKKADFVKIRHMAENIRNPAYGLQSFFDDVVLAFPELQLFLPVEENAATGSLKIASTSGLTSETEYQRTIGALFAVYWLARLDMDGKESFCYGVEEIDGKWVVFKPNEQQMPSQEEMETSIFYTRNPWQKRAAFLGIEWELFERLVTGAGCGHGKVERMMAMLCLTAFHDVMKVQELLPTVQKEHAPFMGYSEGSVINDHDIALAYIIDHFPHLLPSLGGLKEKELAAVRFTQGIMHFNHGWFVQAEAPPGAMLTNFKKVLAEGVSAEDVGFYFYHWITDLSGAQATPLCGAEKFVLGFPHNVLRSFLWSIPFLERLVDNSETTVCSQYLEARWEETHTTPIPSGCSVVAQLRLSVMSQDGAGAILPSFRRLPEHTTRLLSAEMARTGCEGQSFPNVSAPGGPALLVYYAPALMQKNVTGEEAAEKAVSVLTEVFRGARALWPLEIGKEATTVTINVGVLKTQPIVDVLEAQNGGEAWIMVQQNEKEAVVERMTIGDVNGLIMKGKQFQVLDFTREITGDDADASLTHDVNTPYHERKSCWGNEV